MAQKVHIVLEDDLDGSDATETVSFGLDGTTYEIDLNDKNAGELRDALPSYVGHGRKVSGRRRGRRPAAATNLRPQRPGGPRLGPLQRPQGPRARPHPLRRARGLRRRALTDRTRASRHADTRAGASLSLGVGPVFALSGRALALRGNA